MLTIIMKWVSITLLLLAGLWRSSANSELLLEIVVCAGVIPVVLGTIRAGRPRWAVEFVAIALVFNPIGPVRLSHAMPLWLDLTCVAAFLVSLALLKRQPILSTPSITAWRLDSRAASL